LTVDPSPAGRLSSALPYLMIATAALCWSGNHVVGRAIAGHVPPMATSTLRWAIPTLLLVPFSIPHLRRDWPVVRANWKILTFLALIGGAIFGTLQYVGLQYTTALNVSVLNSLAPILIATAGAILFRDRLAPIQMFGIAVSLTGVLVIVARGDPGFLQHLDFNWGDVLIVFNMGLWGIYSSCLRLRPKIHWQTFIIILGALSTLFMLPFFAIEHASGYVLQPTWLTVGAIAYVALFPSLIAYVTWSRGVELIGANRSGAMLHLVALYSAVLAGIFLGERLMPYHLAGFVFILTGVWFAARKP
jgi:drug/metabolite transporter (DMT)-like permease